MAALKAADLDGECVDSVKYNSRVGASSADNLMGLSSKEIDFRLI